MPKILLAGRFHETHCFTGDVTGLDQFSIRRGAEIMAPCGAEIMAPRRLRPDHGRAPHQTPRPMFPMEPD